MTEKTEALHEQEAAYIYRLADELDRGFYDAQMARTMDKAAAELRRLAAVEAQRDALLGACRAMLTFIERHAPRGLQPEPGSPVAMARAAIKSVEESK